MNSPGLPPDWLKGSAAPRQRGLLCRALCQGAALHYFDGSNGV
jgi:hypothetical protein